MLDERGVGKKLGDEALAVAGLARRVILTVPHFTTAAMAIARMDAVTALPRRFAEAMCGLLPLRIVEPPIPLPSLPISLVWHDRTHADEGCRFFRELVLEALRDSASKESGPSMRPSAPPGPLIRRASRA